MRIIAGLVILLTLYFIRRVLNVKDLPEIKNETKKEQTLREKYLESAQKKYRK